MGLLISETYINVTNGYRLGDCPVFDSHADTIGELFRNLQKEYGRCVGAVRIDTKEGKSKKIGWVFQKVMTYEDAKISWKKEDRNYVREVWVTLHEEMPVKTVTYNYKELR